MTSKKEAYIAMMEAELKEWDAKIAQVKAKAEMKAAEARSEFSDQLDELIERQAEARSKLHELKKAGDNAWERLQGGVENAWDSMREAVSKTADRLRH